MVKYFSSFARTTFRFDEFKLITFAATCYHEQSTGVCRDEFLELTDIHTNQAFVH